MKEGNRAMRKVESPSCSRARDEVLAAFPRLALEPLVLARAG